MGKLQCAVVMPVYNEEGCIQQVIEDWDREMQQRFGEKYAIVVVNDGSTDGTQAVLDGLKSRMPRLHIWSQPNCGHGAALLNAYNKGLQLDAEYVFHVDSDNQFLAAEFPRLWENRAATPFLLGRRVVRHDSFHRLVITHILRLVVLALFGISIEDANVPYRLIKSSYLKSILAQLPAAIFAPNIFLAVLAAKDGQNLLGIPVTHLPRVTGKPSILRWKLVKVCLRSLRELMSFRMSLGRRVSALHRAQV